MPDFGEILSAVRDQLQGVARRRADIQGQLAEIEREYLRLSSAVSVMEEHAQSGAPAPGGDGVANPLSVTERVFDAIAGGLARTRGELLRKLVPLDIKSNSVDSALTRLKRQSRITKQGRWFVALDPPPPPVAVAPSPEDSSASS